jgi:serine/threonine-protein kinase
MAQVFKAEDLRHSRAVAVKLLPPEMATPVAAERFLREIRITSRLQHPHILPLLDSGAAHGLCWYVMPLVTGINLRDRIKEGPLPLKEAMRIGIEVAQALAHAHQLEIIHRDMKPENIMLSAGHAMVTDFGLARAYGASGGSSVTVAGLPIGTPVYMSPEQVMGSGCDARSDLYGLVCILYEMVTGRPPYTGNLQTVMRGHLEGAAIPPSQLRPDVPSPFDRVVARGLAKPPDERFQAGADLVEELEMIRAFAMVGAAGVGPSAGAGKSEPVAGTAPGWRKWFGGGKRG